MKTAKVLFPFMFIINILPLFAEPLHSPGWGFRIDLPPDYRYSGGDGKNSFSFTSETGLAFDLAVYQGHYTSVEQMASDVGRALGNRGENSSFDYHGKKAVIMQLDFRDNADKNSRKTGWGLSIEMAKPEMERAASGSLPLLLALSYGPEGNDSLELLKLSVLDSLSPSAAENRYPGPVSDFSYPRGKKVMKAVAGTYLDAQFGENDAEAAQSLVDREFAVLKRYAASGQWQEAWIRFYRAIYRDSWERLIDASFQLERLWNAGSPETGPAVDDDIDVQNREFAGLALEWVQSFIYERDLMGSDFVNLVTAIQEGRGDCDSRAMLWSIIMAQGCIPAGIMVSRDYSHAMGLADLKGSGARFPGGKNYMVAETTTHVSIGMIAREQSDIEHWLAVMFE
ncbi:MAG: hypothetical protein LBG22_09415 [Treponema sp.]|jgi:hypothetical protein|nr:hypothetical protein [Treponema sp.]